MEPGLPASRCEGMDRSAVEDGPKGAEIAAGPGPDAMPKLVDRLERLASRTDTITLDDLVRTIGAQGHAPLLMISALFLVLPVGMIPGVGGALGALVAAIGVQMLLGHRDVWLPQMLRDRAVPADKVRRIARYIHPGAEWLRHHLHVRMETLSGGRVSLSVIAVILIVAGGSLIVVGAIPIAAPLMGFPIAVFSFGILARDGVVVGAGYALLAGSVALFCLYMM